MTYSVEKISREDADRFFSASPTGTAFHDPEIVELLSPGSEWFGVAKGSEHLLIWPYPSAGVSAEPPPFSYYFGPYWSRSVLTRLPSSIHSEQQRALAALLEFSQSLNRPFTFELCPDDTDMRAYMWWRDKFTHPTIDLLPRYSARLQHLTSKSEAEILAQMRAVRRRDLNKIRKSERFVVGEAVNTSEAVFLYEETLIRSGGVSADNELNVLRRLLGAVKDGRLHEISVVDKASERLAGIALILCGKGVANLVTLATSSDFRESGVASLLVMESILWAKRHNFDTFDFNGANSPQRGDDKHSYGARPTLYFRVTLS